MCARERWTERGERKEERLFMYVSFIPFFVLRLLQERENEREQGRETVREGRERERERARRRETGKREREARGDRAKSERGIEKRVDESWGKRATILLSGHLWRCTH